MRRLGTTVVIAALLLMLLAAGGAAQPDKGESKAAELEALPTEGDREVAEAMLLKLEPEEKQLVFGLFMQLEEDQKIISQLQQELATLKLFHKAVLKELEKTRAQLSKLSGAQPAAAEKAQVVIKGRVTSVDEIAPFVIVRLDEGRAAPTGSRLRIFRAGKEIANARVITCEGEDICAELLTQISGVAPRILAGDEVNYVAGDK